MIATKIRYNGAGVLTYAFKNERANTRVYIRKDEVGLKVTIKEIAEKAGVHRATVDKVLHNRAGVSDEVRQKVQDIINELEYTPNPVGRMLQKQGHEFRIAAVLADVDAMPFLKQGIEDGVREQIGFNIRVTYYITKFSDAQGQAAILDDVIDSGADGIIISPINSDRVRTAIDRAAAAGIPVITTNSDIERSGRLCYVGLDSLRASRVAGRLMGQFLGGAGQLAIVSSAIDEENNNYFVAIRERGFLEFVRRHYPGIEVVACLESFEDTNITYEKTFEILEKYPKLQGIYITCGGVTEVCRALREHGREQDVTVLSYEDYPQILELLREDVVNCTLASDLKRQGELPVRLIMDYLVFGQIPQQEQMFTEIKILVKEGLF